jgi:peptide/nickel transport system permease protein
VAAHDTAPEPRGRGLGADPYLLYGGVVVALMATLAVLGGALLPEVSRPSNLGLTLPGADHWLGTDADGRDLLTLIVRGQGRYFALGLAATAVALGLGVPLGLLSGLVAGPVDATIRYVCVVLASFPRVAFLLLVATAVDTSLRTAVLALGATFVPPIVGEVRQQIVAMRQAEFLSAARAHGIDWGRLVAYQILWVGLRARLIRQAAFVFAYVLLIDAALSYVGSLTGYVRIGEPTPGAAHTVGQALAAARDIVDTTLEAPETWWPLSALAGYMTLLVTGLAALGEGLVRRSEK